jgi:secretion/DNA translocation related TadE-like protein
VLALTLAAVTVVMTAATVGVAGAWAARHRADVAADTAALAAADVAVGRMAGDPCEAARAVAQQNGGVLRECAVAGVVVTVTAAVPYAGWQAASSARAGPPGTP